MDRLLARLLTRLDAPAAAACLTLIVHLLLLAFFLAPRGGDPSLLVLAGSHYADRARAPASLRIFSGSDGFDGQFYYALALDPWPAGDTDVIHGIQIDNPPYRHQRILYPLLAHVLSFGGRPGAVPFALVALNLAVLAWLGALGGRIAQSLGRHALWGLLISLSPSLFLAFTRDLTDPLAATLGMATLVALRENRFRRAAIFLSLAVLARESAAVLALACLLGALFTPGARLRLAATGASAIGLLIVWQMLLAAHWGRPLSDASAALVVPPMRGLVDFLQHPSRHQFLDRYWIAGIVFLGFAGALIVAAADLREARPWERIAGLGFLLMTSLLEEKVWLEIESYLRNASESFLLASVLLLASPWRRARVAYALGNGVFFLALAERWIRR